MYPDILGLVVNAGNDGRYQGFPPRIILHDVGQVAAGQGLWINLAYGSPESMAPVVGFQAIPQGFRGSLLFRTVNGKRNGIAVGLGAFAVAPNQFGAGHFCNIISVNFRVGAVVTGCEWG